jgi:hypothetical protein
VAVARLALEAGVDRDLELGLVPFASHHQPAPILVEEVGHAI